MYISHLHLKNFRCFEDASVEFRPGVNVIIGENNSGKTAILAALRQLFGNGTGRKLGFFDIFQGCNKFEEAPAVRIAATLCSSPADTPADRALVAQWLTCLETPWKATLSYELFLPEEEAGRFAQALGTDPDRDRYYDAVRDFLPKYVARIYGGNLDTRAAADPELLRKFGCQFLDALRDAESHLTSGRDQLLRAVLKDTLQEADPETAAEFRGLSDKMRANVKGRVNEDALFSLVDKTGAADDGGRLTFQGTLSEAEFLATLELYVSRRGIELPIGRNGLGYNNLVYIALVLARMDAEAAVEKSGQNAVVFPILLMEEPEAHLHPALQYRLLKYLRSRLREGGGSRQAFITSHSTHVTSACSLDEIVCTASNQDGGAQPLLAYPGKVFGDSADGEASKKYVERYLDATKSNMLFARGVLLVEGLAELLVVPRLAEIAGYPLEDRLVALVAVDGSTFKHFLPLFGAGPEPLRHHALPRPVACLPDADPSRTPKEGKPAWTSCFPYELGRSGNYEYRALSPVVSNLREQVAAAENITIVTGSKTFQYDLALANPREALLVTGTNTTANRIRELCEDAAALEAAVTKKFPDHVDGLAAIADKEGRSAAEFATLYLWHAGSRKGEHALELSTSLKAIIEGGNAAPISVPEHVASAIRWASGIKDAAQ